MLVVWILSRMYSRKKSETDPLYIYFHRGLMAKMFGGLGVALVYTFYYPGGDTIQFFSDGFSLVRMLFINPGGVMNIIFLKYRIEFFYYFNDFTGYPAYVRDPETWFVVRLLFIVVLLSFKSFIMATLILATFSFIGVWRLYKVFVMEFPMLRREMAISVFFIPSVFFWGSGLLKDTITFSAIGFLLYSFYMSFIRKEKIIVNGLICALALYIIISIKPYIFVGLMPGLIIWMVHKLLSQIKGEIARIAAIPILIIVGVVFGYILLNMLGNSLAEYSLDQVMEKAVITQRDLKSDYYRGNSFDIGEFDANFSSMLSKAPIAIAATLFGPFILQANNIVMFVSAIENLIILIFTIRVLVMTRFFGMFRIIASHHMLTFNMIFALFFAFSVGISTSNFGSLVRYKIPCIPFYVCSLYVVRYLRQKEIEEKKARESQYLQYDELKSIEQSLRR